MPDTDRTTPTGDVLCAPPAPTPVRTPAFASLFPPRGADAETHRRHVAASPWPEVVFASASLG
ncbi:hypothetical protein [Phycicoccus flavus]|uniref:hypothetical protein n=1 Tax=Phycicoccus flavus TaxID=2502783 RepID=UPI000FEB65DA|nr:hypothetical protein [Phycicoccus flavus]NHA69645.1 hypothetical protein [Phycicoccus flavus]